MRWVEHLPPEARACGEGFLDIQGVSSAAVALTVAKIGGSAHVTERVSAAVTGALRSSPGLAEQMARLPTPELVYLLGEPSAVAENTWRIPFYAFALQRGP